MVLMERRVRVLEVFLECQSFRGAWVVEVETAVKAALAVAVLVASALGFSTKV
jgi:hypothetical protein